MARIREKSLKKRGEYGTIGIETKGRRSALEHKTKVAEDLELTEAQARYDAACKRLLSHKVFLAWILKSCLDEYKDSDIETIESYIEDTPQVGEVPVGEYATNRARLAGETVAGRSAIGGPKGWSGEHTKRSAVRSHGTPRKRSAGRCEDAGRLCRTEPANKKSRGNEVKIGERRGEKKGTANRPPPRRRSKKAGVAQPASRIKDKRPGGRAYGILDCGTPPVLWSSQGVVTNPCQPGLTSCDAEAGTSHRPFALRQSRTLP